MVEDTLLARAVATLRAGGLVVMPTETVYGLGADARNPHAVAGIFALKGRPSSHPLIVHVAADARLEDWADAVPEVAQRLAEAFWPGPLTLVLPRGPAVPPEVTGGQATVGLRCPAHPVAQRLLQAFGGGIAAPSANRYGRISPTTSDHVRDEFGALCPLVLEGGPCEVGLESTIVGFAPGVLRILRSGRIGRDELAAVAGPGWRVLSGAAADSPRVPGSTLSHYAPRTPLACLPYDALRDAHVRLAAAGRRIGVLSRHAAPAGATAAGPWLEAGQTPETFGKRLYADLRRLDAAGCQQLLVEAVPAGEAWDAARDRLQRAATRESIDGFPPHGGAGQP
ncbi:MAG: hypothetical protein RL026_1809 [Pseudomonadota bacterium]